MHYRRPLIFLFLATVLALFVYGNGSWFSFGAFYNHFFPCMQDPYSSAPCYIGVEVGASLVAFIFLIVLIVSYIFSLWCKEQGSERCAVIRARRARELRFLGKTLVIIIGFVLIGSIVTKLTVHDNSGASNYQRQCGHDSASGIFHDPLARFLFIIGAAEVSPGTSLSSATIKPYTIWRIPIDYLIDPQNYPHISHETVCDTADVAALVAPLPASTLAAYPGWSQEEVTKYQESMQKRLRAALQSLDTLAPSADDLASWHTYHSQACGFSFQYPTAYFVHDSVTKTAYGIQCDVMLLRDTQFAHDWLAQKVEADGLPMITITASDLTPIVEKNNVIAHTALASGMSQGNEPPDPQAAVTVAGEPGKLSISLGIDVFDTISFYHGTKRYDLTTTESDESMRQDFYRIVKTMVLPGR